MLRKELREHFTVVTAEEHLKLIDRVLDDYQGRKVIDCFYGNRVDDFNLDGIPINSDTLMVRLLAARASQKGSSLRINVWNSRSMLCEQENKLPWRLLVLDDALYSGSQKRAELLGVPRSIGIDLQIIAAGPGRNEIKDFFISRRNKFDQLVYLREIKALETLLSEEAREQFIDYYVKSNLKGRNRALWEDDLRIDAL